MGDLPPVVLEAMAGVSRIRKNDVLITVSIFFAFAIISLFARIATKLHHHQPCGLDDYILFFGVICLSAATGLYFNHLDNFYLGAATIYDPTLVEHIPSVRIRSLVHANINARSFSAMVLLWTATFCAKFSFLAFFRRVVAQVPRLKGYWVTTALVSVVVWVYMIIIPFAACPDLRSDSIQCPSTNFEDLFSTLTSLGTALDILTDLLVFSMPILFLQCTTTSRPQRLAISALLSLCVVVVVIAIIRASNVQGKISRPYDSPWLLLWEHIEAVIAIIMVSLTTFNTIFASQPQEAHDHENSRWQPRSWFTFEGDWRNWGVGSGRIDADDEKHLGLVEVPGRGLTSVRSFVRTDSFGDRDSQGSTGKESIPKVRIKDSPGKIDLSRAQRWIDGIEEDPWVTSPSWLKLESIEPRGGPRR